MSLVYVLADDRNYYQNPIVGVEGEWFLCFDDEEEPELVVRQDIFAQRGNIDRIIPTSLLFTANDGPISRSRRVFSYREEGVIHTRLHDVQDAVSYFGVVTAPIPANLILTHSGSYPMDRRPLEDCVVYDWPLEDAPPPQIEVETEKATRDLARRIQRKYRTPSCLKVSTEEAQKLARDVQALLMESQSVPAFDRLLNAILESSPESVVDHLEQFRHLHHYIRDLEAKGEVKP